MSSIAVKAASAAGVITVLLLAAYIAAGSDNPNSAPNYAAEPKAVTLPQTAAGPRDGGVPSAKRHMRAHDVRGGQIST